MSVGRLDAEGALRMILASKLGDGDAAVFLRLNSPDVGSTEFFIRRCADNVPATWG